MVCAFASRNMPDTTVRIVMTTWIIFDQVSRLVFLLFCICFCFVCFFGCKGSVFLRGGLFCARCFCVSVCGSMDVARIIY